MTCTDVKNYISGPLDNVTEIQEMEKNRIYLFPCLAQRKHFTPFVVSVDVLLRKYAKIILKQMSCCLATKWYWPPSQAHNYLHTHMSVFIARYTHRCLHGSIGMSYMVRRSFPPFENGTVIILYQTILYKTQP